MTVLWLTDHNVVLATVAGVVMGVARFSWMKIRKQPVGPLQYLSIALVLVTGISTILTNNPIFVMMKSSLIALAIASVMLTTNWMAPYLPAIVTENISQTTIWWSSKLWGVLLLALAAVNTVIAVAYGLDVWTWYVAFVPAVIQVGAFLLQYLVFRTLIRRATVTRPTVAAA